jgi:hypothetical protein
MEGFPQTGPLIPNRFLKQAVGFVHRLFIGDDEKVRAGIMAFVNTTLDRAKEGWGEDIDTHETLVIIIPDIRKTLPEEFDSEKTVRIATIIGTGGTMRLSSQDEDGASAPRLEHLTIRLEIWKSDLVRQEGL